MKENKYLKDEERGIINKIIYDLKKVNNDNDIVSDLLNKKILNITNDTNISFSSNEKIIINYSLILTNIINHISNNAKETINEDESKINFLLLSSLKDIPIKILCLNIIFKFNEEKNIYPILRYIINKVIKYYDANNNLNKKIFINILKSFSNFLFTNKQYFYAYYFLKKAKNIVLTLNDKAELKQINLFYSDIFDYINKYIKSKYNLFKDKNKMNESKLNIINKALTEILIKNTNKKDIISKNENNTNVDNYEDEFGSFIFMINKDWVMRAKVFIDYYNISLMEKMEDEFLKNAFNEEYIVYSYFNEFKDKNTKFTMNNLYPGPINNYNLLKYLDAWEDTINEDENYFIKDNLIINKDYYLISQRNWNILNEVFDSTNEIKKNENENVELIEIKALILEKRLRKKKNKTLLRRRYIQIRKNTKIINLKKKIIRCINYELLKNGNDENYDEQAEEIKKVINNTEIKFFILDKKNKNILMEICIAFIKNIFIYKSAQLKEIKLSENDSINSLINSFNKKNNILIIEITDKNYDSFLQEIKPILNKDKNNDYIYQCDICENKINLNKKYNCEKCNISLFCSQTCSNACGEHAQLHKFLAQYLKPKFNLEILKNEKEYFDNNSNKGLVGLFNLGNTCYLNSVIQCLSNTLDFRKYFILDFYKNELNFSSFEPQGDIIEEFSKLIKKMWLENDEAVLAKDFFISFCKINKQFSGDFQQDAQEFLSILLLNLHERLNRIIMKPQIKNIEEKKENESDIEASKRWENYDKLKNDSIIYDLFNGQFISTTICQECGKNSTTFEQFNILSLPIPKNHNLLNIKYFKENGCRSFPFTIHEDSTFGDLKDKALYYFKNDIIEKILKNTGGDINSLLDGRDKNDIIYNYNNTKIPKYILYKYIDIIILNKIKMIINYNKINEYDNISTLFDKPNDYEIILYEKNDISPKIMNIYISSTYFDFNNKIIFFKKFGLNIYSYPILLSFDKNIILENIERQLKNKFTNILNLTDINPKEYSGNPIQIVVLHFKKDIPCNFCGKTMEESPYCPFKNLIEKYHNISELKRIINDSTLILAADCKYFYVKKKCFINNILLLNPDNEEKKDNINIYDCLEKFREEEILDKDNKYLCEKCQSQSSAKKKIQIYKAPLYLIIQLKRFKYNNNIFSQFFENTKIETFVEIPEILDLKEYIIGPNKNNSIYELYGNIIHIEDHYVAVCKNGEKWILYNDDSLHRYSFPQSKNSYILFYKKINR